LSKGQDMEVLDLFLKKKNRGLKSFFFYFEPLRSG